MKADLHSFFLVQGSGHGSVLLVRSSYWHAAPLTAIISRAFENIGGDEPIDTDATVTRS